MIRQDAQELLPIIKAFAEGKIIEVFDDDRWVEIFDPSFCLSPKYYRVKPEPKYRPFKTHEECWNEARKHNDFPWIRYIDGGFTQIKNIGKNDVNVESNLEHPHTTYSFAMAYLTLTFNDGTPFGVKEE